jgi:predicted transcriptional regulator
MAEKNPIAQLFEQKTTVTKEKNTDGIGRLFVQNSAQDITNNFEPAKASAKKIFETGWNDATTMQSAVDMWNKLATSAETVGKIDPMFAETAKKYRETANTLTKLQNVYKNYGSAEAYNQAIAENEKAVAESKKAIDDIVNFDANKVRHTIDQLEKVYNDALPLDNPAGYEGWTPQKYWIYNKSYGIVPGVTFNNAESLKAYIDKLKASITQNKKDKELLGYAELIDKTNVVETKDFANKLQNNEYMTEDQRSTYNKLYRIDKEKAKKYWNLIQESVNYAKAIKTYEKIDDSDFLKILYSVPANLDRFGTGLVNTFKPNDSYYAPSAVSITGNMARQDLQGTFGGVLYDALGTISYVAPIIAVSYLSKGVGAKLLASKKASTAVKTFGQILVDNAGAVGRTAMGTSVYGNSYAEMINSGYNVTQAKAYGTLTAISEVLLTDLLSGIAGIGGSKLTANAIKNADSALMQFAIRHGGEAVEEGLQTVLESVFKSAITGKIHEADIGEVLYSALLGFASSASLSGVGTGALKTVDATKNVISKIKANANSVNKTKQTNELIDYALKFPEGAVSREIATMIKGGNGAYTIAEYLHDRNWQMNERDVQNLTDELIGRGFAVENANVVADAIGKVTNGVELTEDQQNALNKDTVTTSVLLDGAVQKDSRDYGTQAEYQSIIETPTEEAVVQTEQYPIEQTQQEMIQKPQEAVKTDTKLVEGKTITTQDSDTLNKLGKALNRKIRVVDSLTKGGQQVNGYINTKTGEIVLNAKAKNAGKVVLKHELTHSLERLQDYFDFFNTVTESKVFDKWLKDKGKTLQQLRQETIDFRQTIGDENFNTSKSVEELQLLSEQEILADFVGDVFYAKDGGIEQMLEDLSPTQKRNFIDLLRDIIRKLADKVKGVDTSLENELRRLEKKFSKMLKETAKNEKSTGEGVKYSLKIKHSNGTIEILNDARNLTKEQAVEYLEQAKRGEFKGHTYIPVRKDTPRVIIDTLNAVGEEVNNLSLVMQVRKAQQAMSENNKGGKKTKHGNGTRGHALSAEEIVEIINNLDNPNTIILQTNRYNTKNEALPNNVAVFVEYNNSGKESVAVIEFESSIAPEFIGTEFGDTEYHTVVTVFEPDVERNGKSFDYAEELLSNPDNFELNIERRQHTRSATRTKQSNTSSKLPSSKDSLTETEDNVNKKLFVAPETDAEYMSAVENGDMKTAQRLVDKTAKEAGYTGTYYHGTPDKFTVFDKKKARSSGHWGKGFYFTKSKSHANQYGNSFEVYLNLGNVMKPKAETLTNADIKKLIEAVAENEDYSIENYGTYDIDKILSRFESKDAFEVLVDLNTTAIGDFAEALKVFNEVLNKNYTSVETDLETVVYSPNQIKSADPVTYDDNGNVIPLSERFNEEETDIRYSISKSEQAETLEMLKNGQITTEEAMKRLDNTKEKPLKELKDVVDLTKDRVVTRVTEKKRNQAEKKDKESRFAENLDKSKWFDKEFKDEARNDNFIQTYAGITNKETLQQAVAELDEGGQERVSKWIRTPAEQATLIDEAIGFILLERAKLNGDLDAQLTIAQKLREYATSGGRKVQLFSIMGRLTPEGMMLYAQTELDQALKAMQERRTKRWLDEHEGKFKLTEADKEYITRRVRQASTLPEGSRAKDILLAEISTRIQNKLPVKSGQSLKALQRISMLLNVKTNIRNVASNALSMGQFQLADLFGTGIDALATKYVQSKGFDAQRTTGFGNTKENIKAFGRGAYNSYDDFRRRINTRGIEQNRYEIGEGLSFDTNTKNKLLNTVAQRFNELDRLTSFLLDFGDRPFYEMWFTNSLNAQMRLNRVDTPTVEMIEIATEEALQRTWQDSNKLTKAANSAKDFLNKFNFNMVMPFAADYGLGDVFIKFTKTPANLAKAIFDFSPVGLTRSIIFDAKEFNESLKKGKYDIKKQKKFVNNLSKGIAGTIIQLAISALASAGILSLTGKNDDDDDVRAFENYVKGMPQYSIKIGDTYITYDWAQPLGAYLATVADYMQEKEANPNNSDFETLLTALSSGGNVLMQQSFLYSLQNLFSSFKGSEGVFTNVIASLFDDPSVYIPQILSQIAELTDDKRRVTYSEDGFERMINKIKVKIPGLRQTLEAERNVLGEEAENPRNDVFNAFFNPGNVYSKVDNEVVDEVYALYKATGEKKAILPKADSSVSANGVNYRYSIEEKANVQKVMGQTAVSIIDEAMNLKDYENLTDQQKVEFLTKVYSYSKAKAKSDIVYSYDFLHAIYGDVLTQDKYNNLSDKQKKMLADAHFLSAYSEVKEGEEAEYFIKKVEDSTKNKTKSNAKEQKANSKTIDTIIKNK